MPGLGVNIAIICSGQILLTKREDFEVWCLPGGGVEAGESVAQAALREAREETGLEVQLTRLVGIYSRPKWRAGNYHIALLAAKPIGGILQPQAGEVLELRYFNLQHLPEPLLFGQHQRIYDALNGIGGSVVCSNNVIWPFEQDMTHQAIYELRDRSGLSRQQFYAQHFLQHASEAEEIEVPGTPQAFPDLEF